jgi:hypothetical protein
MRCIILRLITLATMLALILPTGSMATDHITRPPAFEDTTLRSDGLVVAFADDFSVNPNSGGRWTIHRAQGDPSAEASWGATEQTLYLTRPVASRGTALFANYPLTTPRWRVSFRYRNERPEDNAWHG